VAPRALNLNRKVRVISGNAKIVAADIDADAARRDGVLVYENAVPHLRYVRRGGGWWL
jgi:hypothetical protein